MVMRKATTEPWRLHHLSRTAPWSCNLLSLGLTGTRSRTARTFLRLASSTSTLRRRRVQVSMYNCRVAGTGVPVLHCSSESVCQVLLMVLWAVLLCFLRSRFQRILPRVTVLSLYLQSVRLSWRDSTLRLRCISFTARTLVMTLRAGQLQLWVHPHHQVRLHRLVQLRQEVQVHRQVHRPVRRQVQLRQQAQLH